MTNIIHGKYYPDDKMEEEKTSLSSKILTYISDEERTGGFPEGILEVPKVKEAIKRCKKRIWTPNNKSKTFIELSELKFIIEEEIGKDLIK